MMWFVATTHVYHFFQADGVDEVAGVLLCLLIYWCDSTPCVLVNATQTRQELACERIHIYPLTDESA